MIVTISGVDYDVLSSDTPEALEANGQIEDARKVREAGAARLLYLKRPHGRIGFLSLEYPDGSFSNFVVPLGPIA